MRRLFAATLFLGLAALGQSCLAGTIYVNGAAKADGADGSQARPMTAIAAAMKTAKPGDTVLVAGGVYRESVRVPAGKPGEPITLRAAEGQRVILSGMLPLAGWEKVEDSLYATTLDWQPDRLFVRGRKQKMSREPNEGWWKSAAAKDSALSDPEHLRGSRFAKSGGQIYHWQQHGNTFGTLPIESLDAQAGQLTVVVKSKWTKLSDGDKYYLENRREWIDQPGEWAVEPAGEKFRVYLKPADAKDLEHVEVPRIDRRLLEIRGSHVRVEGIEAVGCRGFGIEVHGASDVHLLGCVAYDNDNNGISLRDTRDSSVRRSIARRNGNGISVSYSQRVLVEECECAYNLVDGLVVSWKSDDVTVRRNALHHHVLWGHPDNFQVFRGVTGLKLIENLFLAAGQCIMMEETRDGLLEGNMLVGSEANMLILGHSNAGHYRVSGNTLALAGYSCMSLTWEGYQVKENVFCSGHGGGMYGVRGIQGYEGDRNLFWNSARTTKPYVMVTDKGWGRDLPSAQQDTGQDKNSIYADPKFRNAPVFYKVIDSKKLDESTRDTWFIRGGSEGFREGDLVEVNFDGERRRIVKLTPESITVEPGLAERPIKGFSVASWGGNENFALDLRLLPDSPGTKLSAGGGPVGSRIDIQAYLRGDFDADGRRDLPPLPAELEP